MDIGKSFIFFLSFFLYDKSRSHLSLPSRSFRRLFFFTNIKSPTLFFFLKYTYMLYLPACHVQPLAPVCSSAVWPDPWPIRKSTAGKSLAAVPGRVHTAFLVLVGVRKPPPWMPGQTVLLGTENGNAADLREDRRVGVLVGRRERAYLHSFASWELVEPGMIRDC